MTHQMTSDLPLMNISAEITALGERPYAFEFLMQRLNQRDLRSWAEVQALLIRKEDDPFPRYLSCWLWKDLLPPKFQPDYGIRPSRQKKYWRDIDLTPEDNSWMKALDICELERAYLVELNKWIDDRLKSEEQLLSCSDEMRLFHRELLFLLRPDSMNHQHEAFQFISKFWAEVLQALGRYFWSISHNRRKALTIQQHRENMSLAKKLKKQVGRVLQGLPPGLEPEYEQLLYELIGFLEYRVRKAVPVRAHKKTARQLLIRELLHSWNTHAEYTIRKVDPDINGSKYIFPLIHAVGEDQVSLNDIYRENRLMQS